VFRVENLVSEASDEAGVEERPQRNPPASHCVVTGGANTSVPRKEAHCKPTDVRATDVQH